MRTCLPLLTMGLLVVHTLATVWSVHHPETVAVWGFKPARPDWGTVLTSIFVHASYGHWLKNALFLILFGWYVERGLDGWRFLCLYVVSGVVAVLTHWAMVSMVQPALYDDSLVGASGAISGLVGYFALRYYRRRVRLVGATVHQWGWGAPMWVAVLLWVVWQGVGAIWDAGSPHPTEIGYWAHLGGFASGLTLAILWGAGGEGEREYLLQQAETSLRYGAGGDALRWLQPLLTLDSPPPGALQLAGRAWALLGERSEACPLLAHALQTALLHPTNYSEIASIAQLLAELDGLHLLSSTERDRLLEMAERQHDYPSALRWIESLVKQTEHPQRPEILLIYARLLERVGQGERARQVLKELQERYPDSLQADLARLQRRG